MSRLTPLLILAALASTASADVWRHAVEAGKGEAARDRYEQALHEGDEMAMRANAKNISQKAVIALVDQAVKSYRLAADAQPKQAEPYFRIASLLESFFTECNIEMQSRPPTCPVSIGSTRIDLRRAQDAIDAWDAFEARAPLDPRIVDALFARAILRTKLVTSSPDTRSHLEGALADYTSLLDHADGLVLDRIRLDGVWGNLAETYMMLGRLDESIEAYQFAIDKGAGSSTYYGKAVALDRDDRGTEALDVIRHQGPQAFDEFKDDIRMGQTFYVPAGEEFYYFALIYEAFGYTAESVANWKLFLKSGAHPQYQPRAKAHLDALSVKLQTTPARPRPPLDPFDAYP